MCFVVSIHRDVIAGLRKRSTVINYACLDYEATVGETVCVCACVCVPVCVCVLMLTNSRCMHTVHGLLDHWPLTR